MSGRRGVGTVARGNSRGLHCGCLNDDTATWLTFFCLWLGGTWPYQAVLQAQSYYVAALGASWLVPTLLVIYTWGLLVIFLLNLAFGTARLLSVPTRVYISFAMTGGVGAIFILQDLLPISAKAHEVAMMAIALAMAAEQILLEPTLYGLAGMMSEVPEENVGAPLQDAEAPSIAQKQQLGGGGLQAMLVGNASAGVIVIAIGTALRVAAGGADLSVDRLRDVTRIFWGVLIIVSLACALIFRAFARNVRGAGVAIAAMGAEGVDAARAAHERAERGGDRSSSSSRIATDREHAGLMLLATADRSADDGGSRGVAKETSAAAVRLRRLCAVASFVWAPATCQFLVYGITLAAWPSIPGRARFASDSLWARKDIGPYWFTFVLAAFNVADFLSRLARGWLDRLAAQLPPFTFVLFCLGRGALLALIYVASLAPGTIGLGSSSSSNNTEMLGTTAAGWVILVSIVVLATSNGFVATVTMMQGPKLVEAPLRDTASFVLVVALYLGLAVGASVSNIVVLALGPELADGGSGGVVNATAAWQLATELQQ